MAVKRRLMNRSYVGGLRQRDDTTRCGTMRRVLAPVVVLSIVGVVFVNNLNNATVSMQAERLLQQQSASNREQPPLKAVESTPSENDGLLQTSPSNVQVPHKVETTPSEDDGHTLLVEPNNNTALDDNISSSEQDSLEPTSAGHNSIGNATKTSSHSTSRPKRPRIPTVLLAGTQKASTSSVAVYLMGLANTCFSDPDQGDPEGHGKEAHFFDANYDGKLATYQSLFHKCPENSLIIDGTPKTMMHPHRVRKIYEEDGTADDVKIIFILREPVSREISWYNHQLRYATLEERPVWTNNLFHPQTGQIQSFIDVQRSTVLVNFRYQQWDKLYGYYAHWLRQWSKLFDRKKQILILSYDELVHDQTTSLYRIHTFLNIPIENNHTMEVPRVNTNSARTPPPPCSAQLEIASYFRRPNEELYQYLNSNPGPEIEQRPFPKFNMTCKALIPSVLFVGAPMAGIATIAEHFWEQETTCFSEQHSTEGSIEEPHFFDDPDQYALGLQQYQQMYEFCDDDKMLIDTTPGTMVYPDKVRAIYDEQGETDKVKIILVLREPVSRQVAAYMHNVKHALLDDPPEWTQPMLTDDGEIRSFMDAQRDTVIRDFEKNQGRYTYGNYVYWIRLWCRVFDRKQILILSYDELVDDPARALHRIHSFIESSEFSSEGITSVTDSSSEDEYDEHRPHCRDQLELARYFAEPNKELYQFLEENPGSEWEQRPFPRFQLECQKRKTESFEYY